MIVGPTDASALRGCEGPGRGAWFSEAARRLPSPAREESEPRSPLPRVQGPRLLERELRGPRRPGNGPLRLCSYPQREDSRLGSDRPEALHPGSRRPPRKLPATPTLHSPTRNRGVGPTRAAWRPPYRGLFPSPPLFDRMPTYRTQGKRSLNFLSAGDKNERY